MYINTKYRTHDTELMDVPGVDEGALLKAYNDINTVNRLLGGNKITLSGIVQLTKHLPPGQEVSIIDIGCGDGEILFQCEKYAQQNKLNWKLTGIDINPHSIALALKKAPEQSRVTFVAMDIFSKDFDNKTADIFLFSLTLHHFTDSEILTILEKANQQANLGIVINDLQRSAVAYRLFQMFSFFFLKSNMAKSDGLVSILRGFKRNDLKQFALKLPAGIHLIYNKWAFRWQWIIKKHAS